jgi:hypothetical protein
MLIFYQQKSNDFTDAIKRKLEEMVVAHKCITVDSEASLPKEVRARDLPVLSDGHQVWKSSEEIKQFLEDLHQDMMLSHSMQSDTCHLDPDNPEECL